jgi:hypothetical protein
MRHKNDRIPGKPSQEGEALVLLNDISNLSGCPPARLHLSAWLRFPPSRPARHLNWNAIYLDCQTEAAKPLFKFFELADDVLVEAFLESCLAEVITTTKITLYAFANHLSIPWPEY